MKLHLGVVDVAYSGEDGAKTTGEVAEILEDKYHIMRIFYELNEQFIADKIADALGGALESLAQGKPYSPAMLKPALPKVDERFRDFLDRDEISKLMPASQQIIAAQKGVSHRKKQPYAKKNKPRPAFVDTGLYQASERSWMS